MKVVNVYHYGGVEKAKLAGIKFCARPSLLGNPCSIPGKPCPVCKKTHFGPRMVQLTECRSIECYRKWLWGKIQGVDQAILGALRELREGDLLGCFCAPRACHLDVVIRAWAWCKNNGLFVAIK